MLHINEDAKQYVIALMVKGIFDADKPALIKSLKLAVSELYDALPTKEDLNKLPIAQLKALAVMITKRYERAGFILDSTKDKTGKLSTEKAYDVACQIVDDQEAYEADGNDGYRPFDYEPTVVEQPKKKLVIPAAAAKLNLKVNVIDESGNISQRPVVQAMKVTEFSCQHIHTDEAHIIQIVDSEGKVTKEIVEPSVKPIDKPETPATIETSTKEIEDKPMSFNTEVKSVKMHSIDSIELSKMMEAEFIKGQKSVASEIESIKQQYEALIAELKANQAQLITDAYNKGHATALASPDEPLTVDVETIKAKARDAGYQEGYRHGEVAGYNNGFAAGCAEPKQEVKKEEPKVRVGNTPEFEAKVSPVIEPPAQVNVGVIIPTAIAKVCEAYISRTRQYDREEMTNAIKELRKAKVQQAIDCKLQAKTEVIRTALERVVADYKKLRNTGATTSDEVNLEETTKVAKVVKKEKVAKGFSKEAAKYLTELNIPLACTNSNTLKETLRQLRDYGVELQAPLAGKGSKKSDHENELARILKEFDSQRPDGYQVK